MEAPEQCASNVIDVLPVYLLLILVDFAYCSGVSIVNFEQVNVYMVAVPGEYSVNF